MNLFKNKSKYWYAFIWPAGIFSRSSSSLMVNRSCLLNMHFWNTGTWLEHNLSILKNYEFSRNFRRRGNKPFLDSCQLFLGISSGIPSHPMCNFDGRNLGIFAMNWGNVRLSGGLQKVVFMFVCVLNDSLCPSEGCGSVRNAPNSCHLVRIVENLILQSL